MKIRIPDVFEIDVDISKLNEWWEQCRARKMQKVQARRVNQCSHSWVLYVNGAQCVRCRGITDPNLVKAARRDGLEVDILADHHGPLRRVIVTPALTGIYTDRVGK